MKAVDECTRRSFIMHYPIRNRHIVEQTYIGDLESIFVLSDGSRILYDEGYGGFMELKQRDFLTDEEWLTEFARRLRKKICLSRLTQKDVADSIGVSENSVSNYICGRTIPNALILKRLADCLECDIQELTTFDYLL